MKSKIVVIVLLISSVCNAQENVFLNNITDYEFKIFVNRFATLKEFPFSSKEKITPDLYVKESESWSISKKESIKYLKKSKESLYSRREYYDMDTDIKTYGKKEQILPNAGFRYFYNEKIVLLIVYERTGVNDGNLNNTVLYIFDCNGVMTDSHILYQEMITYDGIDFNGFGFFDASHFNRYIYHTRVEKNESGKEYYNKSVSIKEFEINIEGRIILNKEYKQKLKFDNNYIYRGDGNFEFPDDDPLLVGICHPP